MPASRNAGDAAAALPVKHLLDPDAPPDHRLVPFLLLQGLLDAPDPVPDPGPGLHVNQYQPRHLDHLSVHGIGHTGLGRFGFVACRRSAGTGSCVSANYQGPVSGFIKRTPEIGSREAVFRDPWKSLSSGIPSLPRGEVICLNLFIADTAGERSWWRSETCTKACHFAVPSAGWRQGSRTPTGERAGRRDFWSRVERPGAGNPAGQIFL